VVSDDIVTRLRNMAIGRLYGIEIAPFEHYNEAADEIERLRGEVKRWSNWASDYAYDDETCECDRCEQVRAAWNAKQ
jgi:hypothetical protein